MYLLLNAFVTDRSNPDEVVLYYPKTKTNSTRLDLLRAGKFLRNDIAMVNLAKPRDPNAVALQILAYARVDGTVRWDRDDMAECFSLDEVAEIEGIAKRMADIAKIHPEMRALLVS